MDRDMELFMAADDLFSPQLMLAYCSLLAYSNANELDGWPTVKTAIRFAATFRVSPRVLAAMFGIISHRNTCRGQLAWCDSLRHPKHVKMTNFDKVPREILKAYGWYRAASAVAARSLH